jgi:hypothetical protein
MNNFSAAITPSDTPVRFECEFAEAAATLAWLYEQPKAMIRRLLYAPEVATPKPDRNAPCPCDNIDITVGIGEVNLGSFIIQVPRAPCGS